MEDLNCVLAKYKNHSAYAPTIIQALLASLNRIGLSGQPPTEWSNIKVVPIIQKSKKHTS